jgi:hypothetical protein
MTGTNIEFRVIIYAKKFFNIMVNKNTPILVQMLEGIGAVPAGVPNAGPSKVTPQQTRTPSAGVSSGCSFR